MIEVVIISPSKNYENVQVRDFFLKVVEYCFEQILEAAPHKTAAVRPLDSHFTNNPRKINKICWGLQGSRVELISNTLLWTITHGHTCIGWPTRTYIIYISLCLDIGCSLEDLPRKRPVGMDSKKESRESMLSALLWWYSGCYVSYPPYFLWQ